MRKKAKNEVQKHQIINNQLLMKNSYIGFIHFCIVYI